MGWRLSRATSRIASSEACDTSTTMPSAFISRMTDRPNSVSPAGTRCSLSESIQSSGAAWTSPVARMPNA